MYSTPISARFRLVGNDLPLVTKPDRVLSAIDSPTPLAMAVLEVEFSAVLIFMELSLRAVGVIINPLFEFGDLTFVVGLITWSTLLL